MKPQILTHVCKSCETAFVWETGDSLGKRWMMYGTCVVLAFLALAAFGNRSHGFGLVMVGLIGVRFWLYLRTTKPQCPSCKSNECVGADSPAGQRIIAGKI
jgi:transposase-like protein